MKVQEDYKGSPSRCGEASCELYSKLLKGDYIRDYSRGIEGDTRSLDYSSFEKHPSTLGIGYRV